MPRYYVHIRDGAETVVPDSEGVELADWTLDSEGWRRLLTSVLHEEDWAEEKIAVLEFQVVDQSGRTVVIAPFRSLLASSIS